MKRILSLILCMICWTHCFGCAGVPPWPSDDYLDRIDVQPEFWAHDNSAADGIQCSVYSAEAVKGGLYINLLITGEEDCVSRLAEAIGFLGLWDAPSEFLQLFELGGDVGVPLKPHKQPKYFILGTVSPAPLPRRVLHESEGQITLLQMCAFRTKRPIKAGEYEINMVDDWSRFLFDRASECGPVNLPEGGQRIHIE